MLLRACNFMYCYFFFLITIKKMINFNPKNKIEENILEEKNDKLKFKKLNKIAFNLKLTAHK